MSRPYAPSPARKYKSLQRAACVHLHISDTYYNTAHTYTFGASTSSLSGAVGNFHLGGDNKPRHSFTATQTDRCNTEVGPLQWNQSYPLNTNVHNPPPLAPFLLINILWTTTHLIRCKQIRSRTKAEAQLSGTIGDGVKMSHFGVSSARRGCVFFLHPHGLPPAPGSKWEESGYSARVRDPWKQNGETGRVPTSPNGGEWRHRGVRIKMCKRFLIVSPLNPLFSGAHLWLSLVCTNKGVFSKINKARNQVKSCNVQRRRPPKPAGSPTSTTAPIMAMNVRTDAQCSLLHISRLSASLKLRSA